MNSIVVLPVKNEGWILEKTLQCLSLWADFIIIADQNSTDQTLEIASRFEKVQIIRNEAKFHTSSVRKLLLDEARKIKGVNLIFSFDADEVPTGDIIGSIESIKAGLKPGDALELQWINLWRSSNMYRDDNSVWSNSWKVFGFVDDRIMNYDQVDVVNDHTARVPLGALKNIKRMGLPKVLHYQFVDWARVMSKQCRYRLQEFMVDATCANILKINHRYYDSKNESNISLSITPNSWVQAYHDNGIEFGNWGNEVSVNWFDLEILKYIQDNGERKLRWLDIWDVDWETKRKLAHSLQLADVPVRVISDPRNYVIKAYHLRLQKYLSGQGFIHVIAKFLSKYV